MRLLSEIPSVARDHYASEKIDKNNKNNAPKLNALAVCGEPYELDADRGSLASLRDFR
jgi:hypothetical protein